MVVHRVLGGSPDHLSLKFLEFLQAYHPEKLDEYFANDSFVYANVPYRIKPYEELLKDPKNTIEFDHEREARIGFKKDEIGGDGALLREAHVFIYKVNFVEKIMATMLAKVANFIPEGGIWMNTQRPEWNDANNALVGNGVSMVTLYYLRRFMVYFQNVLAATGHEEVQVSDELLACFKRMKATLSNQEVLSSPRMTNAERRAILDGLGKAASDYREQIYTSNFGGHKSALKLSDLADFIDSAVAYLEHSIAANKRDDGLYHAYNLVTVQPDGGLDITYLPEMLEGQVAVLSAGLLDAEESLAFWTHSKRVRFSARINTATSCIRTSPSSVLGKEQRRSRCRVTVTAVVEACRRWKCRHCNARLQRRVPLQREFQQRQRLACGIKNAPRFLSIPGRCSSI